MAKKQKPELVSQSDTNIGIGMWHRLVYADGSGYAKLFEFEQPQTAMPLLTEPQRLALAECKKYGPNGYEWGPTRGPVSAPSEKRRVPVVVVEPQSERPRRRMRIRPSTLGF